MYEDRRQAGEKLSKHLKSLNFDDPLVLAIPRGGVVVGKQIALELNADFDVVMTKKISSPMNPEYAIAAVDVDGYVTFSQDTHTGTQSEYIQKQSRIISEEISEKLASYRQNLKPVAIQNRDVVVVDDGLATGLTAFAAIKYLRRHKPGRLTLAIPVAPQETYNWLSRFVDRIVCPLIPFPFYAVGQWYERFDQVDDHTVTEILTTFSRQ